LRISWANHVGPLDGVSVGQLRSLTPVSCKWSAGIFHWTAMIFAKLVKMYIWPRCGPSDRKWRHCSIPRPGISINGPLTFFVYPWRFWRILRKFKVVNVNVINLFVYQLQKSEASYNKTLGKQAHWKNEFEKSLKIDKLNAAWMSVWIAFHAWGLAYEKDRFPNFVRRRNKSNESPSADSRLYRVVRADAGLTMSENTVGTDQLLNGISVCKVYKWSDAWREAFGAIWGPAS
jgi:hypothetical protein